MLGRNYFLRIPIRYGFHKGFQNQIQFFIHNLVFKMSIFINLGTIKNFKRFSQINYDFLKSQNKSKFFFSNEIDRCQQFIVYIFII
jgi:hypothetical protein